MPWAVVVAAVLALAKEVAATVVACFCSGVVLVFSAAQTVVKGSIKVQRPQHKLRIRYFFIRELPFLTTTIFYHSKLVCGIIFI